MTEPTKESRFVDVVRHMVTALAQLKEQMPSMKNIWDDRLYSTLLNDAKLQEMGQDITQAQLLDCVMMFGQLGKFFGNEAVTQSDYGATLNALRTDK